MAGERYRAFRVLPVKDGGGWYVVITPKDGPVQELFGFVTEAQARAWIHNELMNNRKRFS